MLHRYVALVIDHITAEGWTINDTVDRLCTTKTARLSQAQRPSAMWPLHLTTTVKPHGTTVNAIVALNNIQDQNVILEGREIKIPQK